MGAITAEGVVNLSLWKPQVVTAGSKKWKAEDDEQRIVAEVCTKTERFCEFSETVMDVLEKNNMLDRFLVMDKRKSWSQ